MSENQDNLGTITGKLDHISIRMVKEPPLLSPFPMNSPKAAIRVMADFMKDMDREIVCVVSLKNNLQPINMNIVSIGAVNASTLHPREVLKPVILNQIMNNACSMILFHFHPSGDLRPSKEDIEITDQLQKAGDLVGIPLTDHIICSTGNSYYSFRAKGTLPLPNYNFSSDLDSIHLDNPVNKVFEWKENRYHTEKNVESEISGISQEKSYPSSKEQVKEITEKLQGELEKLFDSDTYKNYLRSMAVFHRYSFNNTLLIFSQMPNAHGPVASFTTWKKLGRYVERGQKGLTILAPAPYKKTIEREIMDLASGKPKLGKDGKPMKENAEITVTAFKPCKVFDYSQTGGKELPSLGADELQGDVKGYENFIHALYKVSPVRIVEEDISGGSKGYYSRAENKIAVQKGMSQLQTIKTLIHEISHSLLDNEEMIEKEKRGEIPKKDRETREVIAESVAYTCSTRFHVGDVSDYSFGYIAGWSSGKDLKELKTHMETIRSTSSQLITNIEQALQEIEREQEKEMEMESTEQPALEIYQLEHNEATEDIIFEDLEWLQSHGREVDFNNYRRVYQGELRSGENLNDIYERFNINHPEDYTGRSMSVSDVVVLRNEREAKAYYVDSFGFQELTGFVREHPATLEEIAEAAEEPKKLAVAMADRYITIQEKDGGYDYSIYDTGFRLLTGGVLENDVADIHQVLTEVVTDMKDIVQGDIQTKREMQELDYDGLMEQIMEVEHTEISYIVSECNEFPGLGEYHTGIRNVEEAVAVYEAIDEMRMNGKPSIVMNVHRKENDPAEDIQLELLLEKSIDADILRYVPDLKDNPKVQEGLTELISFFPDYPVTGQEQIHQMPARYRRDSANTLAASLDQFLYRMDPQTYQTAVSNREMNIQRIQTEITQGKAGYLQDYLKEIVYDTGCSHALQADARDLMQRMSKFEKENPIAHVEELLEDNLNMIDGILNNISPKDEPEQEKKQQEKKQMGKKLPEKTTEKGRTSLKDRLKEKQALVNAGKSAKGLAMQREVQ